MRVGLNAREAIEEDGDLFGSTVIMASRIAAKADAGEIVLPSYNCEARRLPRQLVERFSRR